MRIFFLHSYVALATSHILEFRLMKAQVLYESLMSHFSHTANLFGSSRFSDSLRFLYVCLISFLVVMLFPMASTLLWLMAVTVTAMRHQDDESLRENHLQVG